jgi:RNA polymerase sigma-70 factor (ECF subfamily)
MDQPKVAALHAEHRDRLDKLARRMTGDADLAEEVVQETFIVVQRRIEGFRGEADIFTWLYRIAANLALKAKTSLTRERIRIADAEMEKIDSKSGLGTSPELAALMDDPQSRLIYDELIENVKRECHYTLLGLLTGEQRIVYLMRTHEGMSFAQIGKILEIGENAAKSRMRRAVSLIEQELRRRCSLCSDKGFCSCDDCAHYIIHKNPEILERMRHS